MRFWRIRNLPVCWLQRKLNVTAGRSFSLYMDEQVNLTAITSKKSASALLKTSMWMRQRCFREVGRKWCGQTFLFSTVRHAGGNICCLQTCPAIRHAGEIKWTTAQRIICELLPEKDKLKLLQWPSQSPDRSVAKNEWQCVYFVPRCLSTTACSFLKNIQTAHPQRNQHLKK